MAKIPTDAEEDEQFEFLRQVGIRVRLMRERSGMSRRQMTEKTNIKPAYGYLIEGEGQNFTLKTLVTLAQVLGCTPRDLMPDPPEDVDLESEVRLLRGRLKRHLELLEGLNSSSEELRDYLEESKRFGDS